MATKPPDAFLSYTRFDDQHHRGAISEFRRRLADAVRAVSGEPLEIFQDVDGIGIGEHWPDKLDQMLDQARFFIPIVTPSYFTSKACREELDKFLHAEAERGRNDLVLPIYYIECDVLEDDELRAADPLASKLHERQRQDWRELRFKRFEAVSVRQDLERLAREIAKARRTRMPRRADAPISPARVERTPTMRADVASIGVEYDGIRFRSQVEARWAVFFNTVGLKYEYEKGYELDGFRRFSDFWLPELGFWLQVRAAEPTDEEKLLYQRLADSSGCTNLIAIGAPEPQDQLLILPPAGSDRFFFPGHEESRFYFADDRRNEREFWLLSNAGAACSIGPQTGPDHDRMPGLYGVTRHGYEAARRARFEHDHAEALLSRLINQASLMIYTKWKYPGLPVDMRIQELLVRDLDRRRFRVLADLDRVVSAASDAVDRYKEEAPEMFNSGTDYLTRSLGFADDHFRKQHAFAPRTREAFRKWGHLVRFN